jgi:PAS domain-containing protein
MVTEPASGEAGAARIAALEAEVSALRDEVEQSRLILGSATEYAIFALDLEGRISSWNAGARHVLCYAEAGHWQVVWREASLAA